MDDLISRQAVKELAYKQIREEYCGMALKEQRDFYIKLADSIIDLLPSAEPQIVKVNPDLIKEEFERLVKEMKDTPLVLLPSAEPQERKPGHWQITDAYPHNVYCSECHVRFAQTHWVVWEDGSLPRKFCPNCGARMEVDT